MFNKILIANRGEIACRVIRTARRLGIRTVAVYSDADAGALHVQLADEAVRLGEAPSRDSYLRADRIIAAARATGAEAIHPGYGFLSENADFSRACREAGLVFIGPSPEAILAMGSKSGAKTLMAQAGVPLIPGYHGNEQDERHLLAEARKIGFPVLLKASAGGGGKGMRGVHLEAEFLEALHAARREAANAFGDDRMLIEKLLVEPRHVEVQILADRNGRAVYVFDRDCSIQRRHQKVIEEAPAPGLAPELRRAMGEAAVRAAQAIHYEGAGTLEFLVDGSGGFYFMEMNTRLQVEHPVSELISGLDLVELQLRIASGEALPFGQSDLSLTGHAVEARLYAEDPEREFLPSTGVLDVFALPSGDGVRVDTGFRAGDAISIHYDPMMAKVIAWGASREQAVARLQAALQQVRIAGVRHNTGFLVRLLAHPAFRAARLSTHFIEAHQAELFGQSAASEKELLVLAALALLPPQPGQPGDDPGSPWQALSGFRLGAPDPVRLRIRLRDTVHEIQLTPRGGDEYRYALDGEQGDCALLRLEDGSYRLHRDGVQRRFGLRHQGDHLHVFIDGSHVELQRVSPAGAAESGHGEQHYRAPMNGRVVSVQVRTGDPVQAGDTLLVVEAMKMEHRIRAHAGGSIAALAVRAGELVSEGQVLLELQPEAS